MGHTKGRAGMVLWTGANLPDARAEQRRAGKPTPRQNHALVMEDRERVGRAASPTAAIIDSQSAKTTEAGGPRGYDTRTL